MDRHATATRAPAVLALVAIVGAVLLGIQMRLEDPLSSPVLPAEDTFTHMALVREHMRDGRIDPLHEGGALYPPGMHGFLAAAWTYTGADLYQLIRFAPVAFGAIGILGMAFLLWRLAGPLPAVVGALAAAVAPEVLQRTTMMAPTALDVALLPFLLVGLHQVVLERRGWLTATAILALFLLYAHPWLFTILALAGAAYLALLLALPWTDRHGPRPTARGLAHAVALVGVPVSLSINGCFATCGPGFRDVLPQGNAYAWLAIPLALAALVPAVLLRRTRPGAPSGPAPRRPLAVRAALSGLLAVLVAGLTVAALQEGLPRFVDLPVMFGWPILVLAGAALAALPFSSNPAGHLGAALALSTYPFVMFNPLNSPFWPHRTAVYLGLGLIILAGVAAGLLARLLTRALPHAETRPTRRPAWALATFLLVGASLAGTVYAATPDEQGWYRLYEACELDAMREIGRQADQDPSMIVITGSWQAKLVVAALATDATRVWLHEPFFTDPNARDGVLRDAELQDRTVLVVLEPHLRETHPDADTAAFHLEPWRTTGTWCTAGDGPANVTAHTRAPGGTT